MDGINFFVLFFCYNIDPEVLFLNFSLVSVLA